MIKTKKEKMIASINVIHAFLIAAIAILLLGVEACPQAARSGIDFSALSGIDRLYSGKSLANDENFYVFFQINNYDSTSRNGQLCIRDDIDDSYGGISSQGECASFFVKGAEQIGQKTEPGTTTVAFPSTGNYKYSGMPITQAAKIKASLRYLQSSRISAVVNAPEPQQETIALKQDPAVVSVAGEKTTRRKENVYEIALGITLSKQQGKTFNVDFTKQNVISFMAEMKPLALECTPQGSYSEELFRQGFLELEKQRFLNCKALTNTAEQTSYPLLLTLNYGVELEKEFSFSIKAE